LAHHTRIKTRLAGFSFPDWTKAFEPKEIKELDDEIMEFDKPWRAPKVKKLVYRYGSWKDTWKERYYDENEAENYIHMYTGSDFRAGYDRNRAEDLWGFPWLWTTVRYHLFI
jgi:hypothetical protein